LIFMNNDNTYSFEKYKISIVLFGLYFSHQRSVETLLPVD